MVNKTLGLVTLLKLGWDKHPRQATWALVGDFSWEVGSVWRLVLPFYAVFQSFMQ